MKVLTNKDVRKQYKRVIANKARVYGDTDLDKKVIRINKSKQMNTKRGDIIDTIVHEVHHAKHPMKHEKTVRKDTKKIIKTLTKKAKKKYYNMFS